VIRDRLVEWWPLVDVGKLRLTDGDVLLVRIVDSKLTHDLETAIDTAFPGRPILYIIGKDNLDFGVRPRVEMRAEDLVQPKRTTTMD
jgi:hypothetical protein